ncbi:MAG: hypothetical protein KF764_34230 [Labilithrix sp.]|nr:hypothetical protein [Labilithrix sp.]
MHFTRRHLDRKSSGLLVAVSLLAAGAMAASCSSSDDPDAAPADDAGPDLDASSSPDDAAVDSPSLQDAGSVDASPLPIVCTSKPCAISLVTTLGANHDDRSEGFCALLDDGTVACWGANGAGQLGRGEDGASLDSANAARVVGLSNVASLDHTCAVDASGGVWCWGTGPFLRPDAGASTTTERTPVKLDLPPATKVGMGHATACAAASDGVRCWGSNANAQLGPLTAGPSDAGAPKTMPLPAGAPVRALAVGKATFVLREDGTLVTWGGNPPIGRISPIFPDPYPQNVAQGGIATADLVHDSACATAGGIGYCWGARVMSNTGSEIDRALPRPVLAPEPLVQIATTRTFVGTAGALQRYRWCAVASSGSVYCWGFNESGQAGDGTQDYAFEAVKVDGLPETAAEVKTTPNTTCALLTTGKVRCWGSNFYGQLGNGQIRGRSLEPAEVVLP